MKTIFFFSILFYAIALPALGELTPQDLDKIRLIVNEAEKRIKAEVKADIAELKQEIKANIDSSEKNMKEYINLKVDSKVDSVNTKVDSVEKQMTFLTYMVGALIALIVGAIAIPQLIMTWRSRREHSLERRVERLTEEIEALKRQQIIKP
jgi:ABC-type antimicrobial peptide transport system permease subunit